MLRFALVLVVLMCIAGFVGGYFWLGPQLTEAAIANNPNTHRDGIDIRFANSSSTANTTLTVIPSSQVAQEQSASQNSGSSSVSAGE